MTERSILMVAPDETLDAVLDEAFRSRWQVTVLFPGHVPDRLERLESFALIVVVGYSLQELYKQLPEVEGLVNMLPARLPRLYLLQSTDPSLSLVPLKGEQRFFYLRGPLSLRALKQAVEQILAMKPRPVRYHLSSELGISARFELKTPEGVRQFQKELWEISPKGFSFRWEIADPLIFTGDVVEGLELRAHERCFLTAAVRVKHMTPLRNQRGTYALRIGVEFADAPPAPSVEQPSDSSRMAFLTDPLVIRTVLVDAVERKTETALRNEGQAFELHGCMDAADERTQELVVRLSSRMEHDELSLYDIVTVQFVRDNAQLQFSSVLLRIPEDRETLVIRFPKRLDRLWARSTLRYTFGPEQNPTVEVYTPVAPSVPLIRTVTNLSPSGLSFQAHAERDLLFNRMQISRLELILPGGPRLSLQGEVRYLGQRQGETGEHVPCGVRFTGVQSEDHHRLVNYLINKNFPHVRDAVVEDEEVLWRFLEMGEFYTPSKREECLGTPEEVRRTQARMLFAPPGVSRKLIFYDRDQIYGTVSLQQVYQQTWMVHHLCAIRHPSEFVPKSLMLYLGEFISKTPEIAYLKMMWRPNNTWSNKMFGRLVHRLHDGEKSVVKVHSYLHWEQDGLPPVLEGEREWKVRLIEPEEVVELESYFISQEEFFLMRSEDLLRGRVGLDQLDARYRALGLYRERKVLVAMERGRLAGFVLCERSSPGLNLSNLMNTMQLYVTTMDPVRTNHLRRALIRAAIQYYWSCGQRRVIVLTEERNLAVWESIGFEKVKEYVSWTFDHSIANIYNLYCYYIFRLYERLESRRKERQIFYGT